MAIKQFTGNIGDLVEFSRQREFANTSGNTSRTLVGYVWESRPTKVVLSNLGVMRDTGLPRDRGFWEDRQPGERTYSAILDSWDSYTILKPYVAPL